MSWFRVMLAVGLIDWIVQVPVARIDTPPSAVPLLSKFSMIVSGGRHPIGSVHTSCGPADRAPADVVVTVAPVLLSETYTVVMPLTLRPWKPLSDHPVATVRPAVVSSSAVLSFKRSAVMRIPASHSMLHLLVVLADPHDCQEHELPR